MAYSLVFSNILFRPMRTLATILAIALEVVLILLVVGLTRGMVNENARRLQGIGADIVTQPPGTSFFLATNTSAMVEKIADVLKTVEGVDTVAPVAVQLNTQGDLGLIYGINLESFNRITNGFNFISGRPFEKPYEIIIDDIQATSKKLKVGDEIKMLNHAFRVSGIVEHGKGSRVFLPLKTIQELTGTPGKVSLMYIKCASPDQIPQVTEKLKQKLPGYTVLPMAEFVSQVSSASTNLAALRYFLNTVIFISTIVGFFAIFLAMYTAIAERTRDIGILKSLGASKRFVLSVFMKEAFLLSGLGLLLGIAFSLLTQMILRQVLPNMQVELDADWMLKAALIAFLSAGLGGIYPALRAAGKDAIDALAYE